MLRQLKRKFVNWKQKKALENILKEAEHIKDKLLSLKKERANAVSRRAKNEMALKELRSLNRRLKMKSRGYPLP